MNPAANILTGWVIEEVSGKPVTDILDISVGNVGNLINGTSLIEVFEKGSVITGGLSSASGGDHNPRLIAKSGQEIPIDYNITPIKDGMGTPTGIVITFHDITKYKTMEVQLNQSIPSQWSERYGVFYPDKETRVPVDQILTHISHGEAIRDQELFIRNIGELHL